MKKFILLSLLNALSLSAQADLTQKEVGLYLGKNTTIVCDGGHLFRVQFVQIE